MSALLERADTTVEGDGQPSVDVELAVVGAGPVGSYAACCSAFRGLRTAVLDALPEVGGQVSAMYPEKPIFDIAGYLAGRQGPETGHPADSAGGGVSAAVRPRRARAGPAASRKAAW